VVESGEVSVRHHEVNSFDRSVPSQISAAQQIFVILQHLHRLDNPHEVERRKQSRRLVVTLRLEECERGESCLENVADQNRKRYRYAFLH
jgi:hydrogenase maturation factor HypF (carbamoyltransferase family)